MAKHAVPKRKTTKSKSKKRYGSFQTKTLRKLSNAVNLSTCQNCGSKHLTHTVCHQCGQYRGRQVIDKNRAIEKITKVKV